MIFFAIDITISLVSLPSFIQAAIIHVWVHTFDVSLSTQWSLALAWQIGYDKRNTTTACYTACYTASRLLSRWNNNFCDDDLSISIRFILAHRAFSHALTTAILVFQNKGIAAMKAWSSWYFMLIL